MEDVVKALMQNNFNRVVLHMIQQGHRSVRGNVCAYRGIGADRCGVGFLISDDQYSEELEGMRVESLLLHKALVGSGAILPTYGLFDWRNSTQCRLLREVQIVHDCYPVEQWESELRTSAAKFGLTFPDALINEMRADAAKEESYADIPCVY